MEEIEKLRVRVEKDPNSRLFLPLAEEYRKSGMLDEAISVIMQGLERQPGYTSARVALGRLYLEKNMIGEAKEEFEAVVKAIPDNLFAHRKLADIYRDSGETEKAVAEYETVIRLNPIDEEAKMCLSEIKGSPSGEAEPGLGGIEIEETVREGAKSLQGMEPVTGEIAAPESVEEMPEEVAGAVAGESKGRFADEFDAFKSSFSATEEEEVASAEEIEEIPEDQAFDLTEELSFDVSLPGAGVEAGKEADFSEVRTPSSGSGIEAALSEADSFIVAGNYFSALETYRKILTGDPDNRQVLQRTVELKALMKLTGKDGEALIAKLEAFLDSMKRGFPKRR